MKKQEVTYKGINYNLVFDLNVMEIIQEEYGTVEKWGELTDGNAGEVNAKAVLFGLAAMINEGIDMDNEDNEGREGYTPKKFLTAKTVGRLLTEVGLNEATRKLNETVVESTRSDEKN